MAKTGALPISLLKLNSAEGNGVVTITKAAHATILLSNNSNLSVRMWGEVRRQLLVLTGFGEAGISPTEVITLACIIWDPAEGCVANSG